MRKYHTVQESRAFEHRFLDATMVRITLMDYVDFYSLFNFPEKDWEDILAKTEQRFMEQLLLFG